MPWIKTKWATKCAECRVELEEGDKAFFDPATKKCYCDVCGPDYELDEKKD